MHGSLTLKSRSEVWGRKKATTPKDPSCIPICHARSFEVLSCQTEKLPSTASQGKSHSFIMFYQKGAVGSHRQGNGIGNVCNMSLKLDAFQKYFWPHEAQRIAAILPAGRLGIVKVRHGTCRTDWRPWRSMPNSSLNTSWNSYLSAGCKYFVLLFPCPLSNSKEGECWTNTKEPNQIQ